MQGLKPQPTSKHFPFEVRAKLERAAATPVRVTDPLARARAIDAAIAWARRHYPELFR